MKKVLPYIFSFILICLTPFLGVSQDICKLTTAPGVSVCPVTQFDVEPVKAKLVSVPVFTFQDKSVTVVIEVFVPEAIPWLKV